MCTCVSEASLRRRTLDISKTNGSRVLCKLDLELPEERERGKLLVLESPIRIERLIRETQSYHE